MENWRRASWLIAIAGIADAYLWGFDADGRWRLRYESPAGGTLAMLPIGRARRATLDEALWIADCIAFDHDAPVGLIPTRWNRRPKRMPEPISPTPGSMSSVWYYQDVMQACGAAAEIRFGESFVLRYVEDDDAPSTNFRERFAGRKNLVALYAMASRQADLLTEYLCLYRVIEAADHGNGLAFLTAHLGDLTAHDFGTLRVIQLRRTSGWVNAFSVYRRRARRHLGLLRDKGMVTDTQVAAYLRHLRNSLAHGRHGTLVTDYGSQVAEVGAALPIIKLIARMAVDPRNDGQADAGSARSKALTRASGPGTSPPRR